MQGVMRTTKDDREPRRSSPLRLWSIIHHGLGHRHRRPAANTMRICRNRAHTHAHNLASPLPQLRIASKTGHPILRSKNGGTSSISASCPSTVDHELLSLEILSRARPAMPPPPESPPSLRLSLQAILAGRMHAVAYSDNLTDAPTTTSHTVAPQ
jgi:hypothetical protein